MKLLKFSKLFSFHLVIFSLIFNPLASIAQEVDPAAGTDIHVHEQNNTTIIDIEAANSSGLSHNRFDNYSAQERNHTLNNSAVDGVSVQAGDLDKNVNFNNGSDEASKILFEVLGSGNKSNLTKNIEIFGKKADFILANSKGITCSGCGFINTSDVSLVTGNVINTADVNNIQYQISEDKNSNILINDQGITFYGNNNDEIDFNLISRAVKIAGELKVQNAKLKHLNIRTGAGEFNSNTKSFTNNFQNTDLSNDVNEGTDDEGFAVVIDSTAVGGVRANQISIIATEEGAGVRTDDKLISDLGSIEITADGDIKVKEMKADFVANQEIKLTSKSQNIETDDDLLAQRIIFDAKKNLRLNQNVTALDSVNISAADFTNYGFLSSSLGDIIINTNNAINKATINAGNDLNIASTNTIINTNDHTSNALSAKNKVIMNAATITNDAKISAKNVEIDSSSIINKGHLIAQENLNIAAAISNEGEITSNGLLILDLKNDDLENLGIIESVDSLEIKNAANIENEGSIKANDISLQAQNKITNAANAIIQSVDAALVLDLKNSVLENYGIVKSQFYSSITSSFELTSLEIKNAKDFKNHQTIDYDVDLALTLSNSKFSNFVTLNSKLIELNSNSNLVNESTGLIQTQDHDLNIIGDNSANSKLTNYGVILASDTNAIDSNSSINISNINSLENLGGVIKASNDLNITAANIKNESKTENNVTYHALLMADKNINLDVNNLINDNSNIISNLGDIAIYNSTNTANEQKANSVINKNSAQILTLAAKIDITNNTLFTDAEIAKVLEQYAIEMLSTNNFSAEELTRRILALRGLLPDPNLTIEEQFQIKNSATGNIIIKALTLNNEDDALISSNNYIEINADEILNQNAIIASANYLDIKTGELQNISNDSTKSMAQIYAASILNIKASGNINNDSGLIRGSSVYLDGANVTNSNKHNINSNIDKSPFGREINLLSSLTNIFDLTNRANSNNSNFELFALNSNPLSKYLISLNTNFGSKIESDEHLNNFLNLLNIDLSTNNEQLIGDDFYLSSLIAKAIAKETGNQYITFDAASNINQLASFLNTTKAQMDKLKIEFGQELSEEQRAELTDPFIAFKKERIVVNVTDSNGNVTAQDHDVFVPIIYTPNQITNSEINSNIASRNAAAIESRNEAIISATNNVTNNADIKAGTIIIEATNFINEFADQVLTIDENGFPKYVSKAPKIEAKNDIIISVKEDFRNIGAEMIAGNALFVDAKNINISAAQSITNSNSYASGRKWAQAVDSQTITNTAFSSLTGNNIILNSSNDINIIAASLTAKNAIQIDAGNNLLITSAKDETNSTVRNWGRKGSFSQYQTNTVNKETNSNLTAGNIYLNSGNRLSVTGANINTNDLIATSLGKITFRGNNSKTTGTLALINDQKILKPSSESADSQNISLASSPNDPILPPTGNSGDDVINNSAADIVYEAGQGEHSTNDLVFMTSADIINHGYLLADGDISLSATNITNSKVQNTQNYWYGFNTTLSGEALIKAGGNVLMQATNDINNYAGTIIAETGNITLLAGNNVNIGTMQERNFVHVGGKFQYHYDKTTNHASNISAGNNIVIKAGNNATVQNGDSGNINITGSNLTSGTNNLATEGHIFLNAANDITIKSSVDSLVTYGNSRKSSFSLSTKTNNESNLTAGKNSANGSIYINTFNIDESNQGAISTPPSLALKDISNNVNITGSNLTAKDDVYLTANNNITIESAQDTYQRIDSFKSKRKSNTSETLQIRQVSSDITAQNGSIEINALGINGDGTVAITASNLNAKNDLNITSANNTIILNGIDSDYSMIRNTKKGSLKKVRTTQVDYVETAASSVLTAKNISINSGNNILVQGSDLNSKFDSLTNTGGNTNLTAANDVIITNAILQEYHHYSKEVANRGLFKGVSAITSAITSISNLVINFAALPNHYIAKAIDDPHYKEQERKRKDSYNNQFYNTKVRTNTEIDLTKILSSNINAENNLTITAGNSATIQGSNLTSGISTNPLATGKLTINASDLNIAGAVSYVKNSVSQRIGTTFTTKNVNSGNIQTDITDSTLNAKNDDFTFNITFNADIRAKDINNPTANPAYLTALRTQIAPNNINEEILLRMNQSWQDTNRQLTEAGQAAIAIAVVVAVTVITIVTAGAGAAPAAAAAGTATATAAGAGAGAGVAAATAATAATTATVAATSAGVAAGVAAGSTITLASAATAAGIAAGTAALTTATISATQASMNADGDIFKQAKGISKESWDATTSKDAFESYLIAAGTTFLTMGITSGLNSMSNGALMAGNATNATISQQITTALAESAISTTASTAVQSTINGDSFKEALKNQGVNILIGAVTNVGAKQIGGAYHTGNINKTKQLTLHALLGCGAAVAGGNDCASGAVSGMVGEEVGSYAYNERNLNREIAIQLGGLTGGLSAIFTGSAVGLSDSEIADNIFSGQRIGENAARNNATYVDKKGKIIAVDTEDEDKGVYVDNEDGGTRKDRKIGETEYIDEFIYPDGNSKGKATIGYIIYEGESIDNYIKALGAEGGGNVRQINPFHTYEDLKQLAADSNTKQKFDIKTPDKLGYYNGYELNGYYVSGRSAGNYLAGYNSAMAKPWYFTHDFFLSETLRRAGALHNLGKSGSEIPYSIRQITKGYENGK